MIEKAIFLVLVWAFVFPAALAIGFALCGWALMQWEEIMRDDV